MRPTMAAALELFGNGFARTGALPSSAGTTARACQPLPLIRIPVMIVSREPAILYFGTPVALLSTRNREPPS